MLRISHLVPIVSCFLFLVSSTCFASGLSLYPAHQDIIASQAATVTYHNQSTAPVVLDFFLQQIIATDLLGRLQFNAPLPQTLQSVDPQIAVINPNQLNLNPGQIATVTASFDQKKLNPGTTAFLLLAQIEDSPLTTDHQSLTTNLTQYLGSSILVTAIGGHTTKLELISTSLSSLPFHFTPPDFIQLTIKNSGNTRSIPKGVVITKDIFGREIMRGAINGDSTAILPGSQRLIYAHLQPSLSAGPIGIHSLTLTGSDDVGQSHFSYTKTYLYLNPWLVSGMIAIIALSLIIKKKIKH